MQREPVASSNIVSVGYDPEAKILEIEFKQGNEVYQYKEVPNHIYKNMMASGSHGSYFHKHIKNVYAVKKLTDKEKFIDPKVQGNLFNI